MDSQTQTFEIKLENSWKLEVVGEHWDEEMERFYNVDFKLFRQNGNDFELVVCGQVKHNGCADIGYNQPTMIHFCGEADCDVFRWIYECSKEVGKW